MHQKQRYQPARRRCQRPITAAEKDAYNHASVITGYNARRGEVIFTESWGEAVRNRRMRVAEMKATCHYTFYVSPRPSESGEPQHRQLH